MIIEIISFYKTAPKLLESEIKEETLGYFLNKKEVIKILYRVSLNTYGCRYLVDAI